jgi:hypothetical protein
VASVFSDGMYHGDLEITEYGYWVEAKDLRVGDVFVGANGELSVLLDKERIEYQDGITVYNFAVDGNHNYFVIARDDEFGQTCILVHNAQGYKNFNLPGFKNVKFIESHILSGHKVGGERLSLNSKKDIFPATWSARKIMKSVKEAFIGAKIVKKQVAPTTQEVRYKLLGKAKDGTIIQMWYNKTLRIIESAWPKL